MERLLVISLIFVLTNSQAQYSYFNIHRTEVAPLPTFRPFNPNQDPLMVAPPASPVGPLSPVEQVTQSPTEDSTPAPPTQSGPISAQIPGSFYYNSFQQHHSQLNPFLFNGFPTLSHNEAKSIGVPRNFPNQIFGNGFPFTNINQLPPMTSYYRGPQGHYQTQGQNSFGYGYNPYQRILPPPIIYQIIYYQLPANDTATTGNETTTETKDVEVTTPSVEVTTQSVDVTTASAATTPRDIEVTTPRDVEVTTPRDIEVTTPRDVEVTTPRDVEIATIAPVSTSTRIVEIATLPITSNRLVEELKPKTKAITTTTPATTTTSEESAETTTAATTSSSTENTTEK